MDDTLGPDERMGIVVVVGDEALDMGDQFRHAAERRALEGFPGQDREPDFDLVQPRRVRRCVMELHVRVPRQPHVPLWLVGGQVVQDHVDFHALVLLHDAVHEVEEFKAAPASVMLSDHLTAPDVERGE